MKPRYLYIGPVLLLAVLLISAYMHFDLNGEDYSANQVESRRVFGATYMTMNNPFYEIVDDEIRSVIEGHGDVLLTRDPALDQAKQNEQIYELIRRKVAAIFVTPVDWRGVTPALEAAKEAGIPVIAVDAPVYGEDVVTCTIVSDNYQAGVLCAEHLMAHKDGGTIVLLTHPGAKSAVDRIEGFQDTIEGDSRLQIAAEKECSGQLELAMPAMEQLLSHYPEADIVMALNDPSAMGAMAALEEHDRLSGYWVYGVDGSPDAKAMIAEGMMTATASQFPNRFGRLAAQKAYEILDGTWDGEPEIVVDVELVTAANLKEYGVDGWK